MDVLWTNRTFEIAPRMKKRILMLLGNAFGPDPRVLKEARSLVNGGFEVVVLAWDREGRYPELELLEGIRIKRLRVKSKFGRGVFQVPFLIALFVRFVCYGIFHRYDIIHCHDFDTLPAGALIKIFKLFQVKLIYDSHENFPVQKALELPQLAYPIMAFTESLCVKFVDQIFTASSILRDEFQKAYRPPVVWLPNFANKDEFAVSRETIFEIRKKIGFAESDFVIAYIGGLRPGRSIIPFISAVSKRSEVRAFICGSGEQKEKVKEMISSTANVKYVGTIPQSDVIPYYFACDVLYYGLINYPGAMYNAPNNFSYAMLAGKPIIGTGVGDLGRFVRESGCGIIIQEASEDEIGKAIDLLLKDRSFYESMKARIGSIANQKYHWGIVEGFLLRAYLELIDGAEIAATN